MPISGEPLVRAALGALRREMESLLHLRRALNELNEALASGEHTEAEQASGMGPPRPKRENGLWLSALIPFCSNCQFTLTIPADPAVIPIVTDGVGELMAEKHWSREDVFAVQLALQEAVANAIRHGCRGDVSELVHCSVSCDESDAMLIVVRDPGPGFDPSVLADPLDATNILKPSGRGIFLINKLMDQVQFADGGREVQMRKRKTSALTSASK